LGSALYRRSESVTIMEPILITGATGKIGGAVAAQLLSRGVAVRAFVRSDDARAERLRCAGAEVFVGDMFDFDSHTLIRSSCRL